MPWSGGNFTRANGNNGWVTDATNGIGIEAGRHDTQDNDFKDGIDQCLNKDGSNAATGNLNFGNFRPTNINAGTAAAPAICAGNDVNTGVFGPAADTWAVATNGVERLRIDNAGSLGINGASRAATILLDVQKNTNSDVFQAIYNANAGSSANAGMLFGNDTNQYGGGIRYASSTNSVFGSNTFAFVQSANAPMTFSTNGAERMRITSAGRLGLGTGIPNAYVQIVNGESNALNTTTIQSNVAGDVGTHALLVVKTDNNSTTTQRFVGFSMNGAASGSGQINANGANAAAFGSYSDERLKENIVNLPSQLANILALRPVEFDYKDGTGHQLGFIAQEVQQIFPDLVGESDGFLTLTDMNKNDARLIKAFQELHDKVAALEERVAELEEA